MYFQFHELANVFPLMAEVELSELAQDIKKSGLHHQIVLYEGKVLEGRNRYNAMKKTGLQFSPDHFRDFDPQIDGDPVSFVISENIMRRHLSTSQRAALLAELLVKMPKQKPGPKSDGFKSGIPEITSKTEQTAAMAKGGGVSLDSVQKAAQVLKEDPALHAEVKAGKKTVHEASQEVKAKKQAEPELGKAQKVRLQPKVSQPPPPPKKPKFAFDAVGVDKYIIDKHARNWFWQQCEEVRVPFACQAKLAALLANEAVEHNKGTLSLSFAKRYEEYIRVWAEYPGIDISQEDINEILTKLDEEKLLRLAEEIKRRLFALARAASELTHFAEKMQTKTQVLDKVFDFQFRRYGLQWVKQTVDKLVEKFPPS
jgi:hypothetical protein